jgi:hypothetical protein
MHFSTSPVIGTIAIKPRSDSAGAQRSAAGDPHLPLEADDSSLESLLASLVRGPTLASLHDRPACFIASGRLSRFALLEMGDHDAVRADVTRLCDDLEAEYDRLAMA